MDAGEILISEMHAELLAGPVAMSMASHDADLLPSLSWAYGCQVSADRREVVVYLSPARCPELLRDIESGQPVAMVVNRPRTHVAIQLKAPRARIRPMDEADLQAVRSHGEAFVGEIVALGFDGDFARAVMTPTHADMVAVVFVPTMIFEQTPGPKAGMRLAPDP